MKTFDGTIPHPADTEPAPPPRHEKEPGCCGPVTDRITLVTKMSKMLSQGHTGLASIYDSIAKDMEREENKAAFTKAAENQRRLAEESGYVTALDVPEEEQPIPEGACRQCGKGPDLVPMVDVTDGACPAGRYHVGCIGAAILSR